MGSSQSTEISKSDDEEIDQCESCESSQQDPSQTGASGGLREAMSCGVCSEVYEQSLRTPLVLPCGHTFCRVCLTDIKKSGRFHCPNCRAGCNNLQVEALTVNYTLLNILPLCNQFECDKCALHGDDLRYWCSSCDQPLCSICLYSGHPQGHTVKLAQAYVNEEKQFLVDKIRVISQKIEEKKNELKEGFNILDTWMKQFLMRYTCLQAAEAELTELLVSIQEANDISSVVFLDKAVEKFRAKERRLPGASEVPLGKDEDSEGAARKESSAAVKRNASRKEAEAEAGAAAAKAVKEVSDESNQETTEESEESTESVCAELDYHDGRMLLLTLAKPATTRLSLKVPCEVFLELSVGKRCLGRVYISLWCHLRQAQQFMALCMGTMGPSLLGTKASEKVRNVIVFRSAIDRNNQQVAQALMMGLEWGGQHSKTEAEGLVTGMAGNNGIAFGICTQGQTNAAMNAPFGMVVSGLAAANEAFQQNPVTDVTITNCGFVLPGLAQ